MSRHHILPPIVYVPQPKPKKIETRKSRVQTRANGAVEDTADVEEAFATWRDECARADEIISSRALDATGHQRTGREVSMRWILAHMVEEYSRHNGHADLLRERIDGATGYD